MHLEEPLAADILEGGDRLEDDLAADSPEEGDHLEAGIPAADSLPEADNLEEDIGAGNPGVDSREADTLPDPYAAASSEGTSFPFPDPHRP